MSPGQIDDYVTRLERELRRRGQDDPRMLAEAREHLVDAVDEGRRRGLSIEEAEREALDRFGAPGVVAAHMEEERQHMTGFSGALRRAWHRKWWILAPTALAAIIASVASHFLPVRYRAETTLLVVPQRVPECVQAGHTLTAPDVHRLEVLFQRRDDQIRYLYEREKEILAVLDSVTRSPTFRIARLLAAPARIVKAATDRRR